MRLFRNPVTEVIGFYLLAGLMGITILFSVALPIAATLFFVNNIS